MVVLAREASARLIATHGLTVESAQYGTWTSDVPAVTEVPEGAHVILATKAYAVLDVAPALGWGHGRRGAAATRGIPTPTLDSLIAELAS